MSSMFAPFDDAAKARPEAQQTRSNSMLEPVPSYAEASSLPTLDANETVPRSLVSPPETTEEPPAYAVLDSNQTTFMIYGTFIHTPAGPAYQLSSPLDQRGPYFRIRRLRAKEVSQLGRTPIAFDKTYILYEVNDPPLLENEFHMQGKRRACLPGVLELKFGLSKWHIKHVPRAGAKPKEILTRKSVGAFGRTKLDRKKEMAKSEWKDAQGRVLATEVLKVMEDESVVPTVELSKDLDQTWRELLLSLWAARLWIAFGQEKTNAMGGRYGQVRFAKYSGQYVSAGGAGMLGLGVIGLGAAGGSG